MKGEKILDKAKIQKIVLLLLVGLGLLYLYYTYLFTPQWALIQQKNAQVHERESYYQNLASYIGKTAELEKEIQTLELQRKQLETQVAVTLDKPQIAFYLQTIAKQHSVDPQKVDFGQLQTKEFYQELGLTFSFLGKVTNVLSLIRDLQNSGGMRFVIQSVDFSAQTGSLQVVLKLALYNSLSPNSGNVPQVKPPFMNYPFGTGTTDQMFK